MKGKKDDFNLEDLSKTFREMYHKNPGFVLYIPIDKEEQNVMFTYQDWLKAKNLNGLHMLSTRYLSEYGPDASSPGATTTGSLSTPETARPRSASLGESPSSARTHNVTVVKDKSKSGPGLLNKVGSAVASVVRMGHKVEPGAGAGPVTGSVTV